MNITNQKITKYYKIDYILLIVICLSVRIYHINTIDLWTDEIYHFFSLHSLERIGQSIFSVRETLPYAFVNILYKKLISIDIQYQYNFIPRLPALIFGLGTVILLYTGFKKHIGNIPAYIVACISITSYPLIIYSIRSRVYSMTQCFFAVYIYLLLMMVRQINIRNIVLLWISSILGFLTYPYMILGICFVYICIGINMIRNRLSTHRILFFISALSFFIPSIIMLVIMKSTFSHPMYEEIPFSFSFFLYATRGILSYYSGNSYILVLIAFLFPFINFYNYYRGRSDINYIHLFWLMCSINIILHIFIVTNTNNAFNPRHITFLAIPFIASVSYGVYEFYIFLKNQISIRYIGNNIIGIFIIAFTLFMPMNRDFSFYMKTGQNYHGGSNNYSERIHKVLSYMDKISGDENWIVFVNRRNSSYYFYYYRSNKKIVSYSDFHNRSDEYRWTTDNIAVGFLSSKHIREEDIPQKYKKQYDIFEERNETILLRKNMVPKNEIINRLKTEILLVNRII